MNIPEKIKLSEIIDENRTRKDYGDVELFGQQLKEETLIHPLILTIRPDGKYELVAGGRRRAALLSAGFEYVYHGLSCVPDKPGFLLAFEHTERKRKQLELVENLRRKDMSWQERVVGIKEEHELAQREAALNSKVWGQQETADLLGIKGKSNVCVAIQYAEMILDGDQEIIACETLSDAIRVSLRRDQEKLEATLAASQPLYGPTLTVSSSQAGLEAGEGIEAMAESSLEAPKSKDASNLPTPEIIPAGEGMACSLCEMTGVYQGNKCPQCLGTLYSWIDGRARKLIPSSSNLESHQIEIPLSQMLLNCNCIEWMLAHPNSIDHIITDPPYGIDVANINQSVQGMVNIDTIANEHEVEENLELFTRLFPAAFVCLKDCSYCITWCDEWNFREMADIATIAGFKAQRWSFHWIKPVGDSSCINQSARINFTKRTEIALICRKGNATLVDVNLPNYVIANNKDDTTDLCDHPFAKPYAVWEPLIKAVAIRGQTILEPFAGEGSGVLSMLQLGQRVIACEKVPEHYNKLLLHVKQHYQNISPNFVFV